MAIFNMRCKACGKLNSRMLKTRPLPPPPCPKCGGETDFEVETSSKVVEVYDTGRMTHQVTQIDGVSQLLRDRSREAERPDPEPVKLGKP